MLENEGNITEDELDDDESQEKWEEILWSRLRDELIPEIPDNDISNAVNKYRHAIIRHMVRTGEIALEEQDSTVTYFRTIWKKLNDEPNTKHSYVTEEIGEDEIDIPFPSEEIYTSIIVDIWLSCNKDPTWSLEYSFGSKTIKRNKRDKTDSYGLSLSDHALIYYYAKQTTHYSDCKDEKEKLKAYISRHQLDTDYAVFKILTNKYLKQGSRFNSGQLGKIYSFLEERYTVVYFQIDHADFVRSYHKKEKGRYRFQDLIFLAHF